jgi:hypothetical protein
MELGSSVSAQTSGQEGGLLGGELFQSIFGREQVAEG